MKQIQSSCFHPSAFLKAFLNNAKVSFPDLYCKEFHSGDICTATLSWSPDQSMYSCLEFSELDGEWYVRLCAADAYENPNRMLSAEQITAFCKTCDPAISPESLKRILGKACQLYEERGLGFQSEALEENGIPYELFYSILQENRSDPFVCSETIQACFQ